MTLMLNPTYDTEDNSAGIGHNSMAGEDFASLLAPEGLKLMLTIEHERVIAKTNKLIASYKQWKIDTAQGLKSEDDVALSTDFGAQLKRHAKNVEELRKLVKAPFSLAEDTVQRFWRNLGEPCELGVKDIEKEIGKFKNAAAALERARLQELADQQRKEADALAENAIKSGSNDLLEQAKIVDSEVRQIERQASAPLASFTQTRGDYAMSSASVRYKFTVENFDEIPRQYLIVDESKVRAAINGKQRVESIRGLKIEPEYKTTIRS